MTTEATDMETVKAAYMMANTHAAVWAGLGPVDQGLVEDLTTAILQKQQEESQTGDPPDDDRLPQTTY